MSSHEQVGAGAENPAKVSAFEVVEKPDGITDPWDDAEDLAREGAALIEKGEIDIENLQDTVS